MVKLQTAGNSKHFFQIPNYLCEESRVTPAQHESQRNEGKRKELECRSKVAIIKDFNFIFRGDKTRGIIAVRKGRVYSQLSVEAEQPSVLYAAVSRARAGMKSLRSGGA